MLRPSYPCYSPHHKIYLHSRLCLCTHRLQLLERGILREVLSSPLDPAIMLPITCGLLHTCTVLVSPARMLHAFLHTPPVLISVRRDLRKDLLSHRANEQMPTNKRQMNVIVPAVFPFSFSTETLFVNLLKTLPTQLVQTALFSSLSGSVFPRHMEQASREHPRHSLPTGTLSCTVNACAYLAEGLIISHLDSSFFSLAPDGLRLIPQVHPSHLWQSHLS